MLRAARTEAQAIRGGTYYLVNPETNQIVRTGRTGNFARRAGEHARDPALAGFQFEIDVVIPSSNYAGARGREQILYDAIAAPYSKIRGIDPRNPMRSYYLREGAKLGINSQLGL